MELEHYMNARHPNCGLKSLPHVDSKIRAWKKSYATISLLKSRSGLGFQYSDGSILVDDPKAWDDLIKVDPNAKSMNLKKWPLFADWEVIFGKDRATGEFAEGPEDAVEEIERIEAQEITDGMSVGFPIDVVDVDDASGTREDQAAQEEPNVSTGATQSPFTTQDEPNESTGAAQSSYTTQKGETHQSQKQGNSFKASSSKVNEKGRCKKRKTTEDDNETVLKGLMEVMKQFTESHDKRMASLIDKLGERDLSEIRGKIFSIIGSPAFEIYSSDERVKAAMGITQDIKRMEFFLSISELERHTNSDALQIAQNADPNDYSAVGVITKIQSEIQSTQMLFCQNYHVGNGRQTIIKIGSPTKRRSNMSQKRARVWTQEEELTLVDGLKTLCANDWKEDDGIFKHGYLMELEQHMNDCHPNSGLQALPHIFSKIRGWKNHYMTLSLVKSRSGLGFRYSDGTILVEDPKAWDDFIKVDPYAKSMTFRKWPLFVDWEEIFRKDGATEQSAEGPEVGVQEIERIKAQEVANDMSFEFPSIVVDEDDAPAKKEDQIAQGEPSVLAGATQSSWSAF
ncbi:hypothetical protein KY289_012693 [Solanum tuberosum]|nr:hypothetical protein KY289_012693 [Solanum tuberosum]KAH0708036.1 hypothetical protein KY284_009463 [Solanum tuberosum]